MLRLRSDKVCAENTEIFVALAGNPNVGKTTLFNRLTGMKQHTGNWAGKTVSLTSGLFYDKNIKFNITDLPGTYSLQSDSPEETIAKNSLENDNYSCVVIVVDSTMLERNLNLVFQILHITQKAVLCLNFSDELKKKGIFIDTDELSLQLGIPVVSVAASKNRGIDTLIRTIVDVSQNKIKTNIIQKNESIFTTPPTDHSCISERISNESCKVANLCVIKTKETYGGFDKKLDQILLSPIAGIPVMLLIFASVFWLTAFGANYPGELLSMFFDWIKSNLNILFTTLKINSTLSSLLVDGIYVTVSWVITVMLPPAMIFFPLFAVLEDTGILPRIAFNLDKIFAKSGSNGKQALTMLMGFGCNACGVMGCRIINNRKERLSAIVTNSFIPCNGRLPTLIALISIFFCSKSNNSIVNSFYTTGILMILLLISVSATLLITKLLSKTIKDDTNSGFLLELPPYRKPQILKVILLSIKEKVFYVLSRAVAVAVPAGALIWLLSNIRYEGISILKHINAFLEPFASLFGIDGVILTAVFLSFPANEILIPIILMSYCSGSTLTDYTTLSQLESILYDFGWKKLTALCTIILCLFHFPCSTTCFSIKKETGSLFWTIISVLIPLVIGLLLCFCINSISTCIVSFS